VKDQQSVSVDLYFSVYGPTLPNPNGHYYSVKWAALDAVETSFDALLLSNTASSLRLFLSLYNYQYDRYYCCCCCCCCCCNVDLLVTSFNLCYFILHFSGMETRDELLVFLSPSFSFYLIYFEVFRQLLIVWVMNHR
jgi:hypothetical protein